MNWFYHLQGYEDGHYEGKRYGRYKGQGIIISLIFFVMSLAVISFRICYVILEILFIIIRMILKKITGEKQRRKAAKTSRPLRRIGSLRL